MHKHVWQIILTTEKGGSKARKELHLLLALWDQYAIFNCSLKYFTKKICIAEYFTISISFRPLFFLSFCLASFLGASWYQLQLFYTIKRSKILLEYFTNLTKKWKTWVLHYLFSIPCLKQIISNGTKTKTSHDWNLKHISVFGILHFINLSELSP